MPRLRNKQNGAVINVDDETAESLPPGLWESADDPGTRKLARKTAKSES